MNLLPRLISFLLQFPDEKLVDEMMRMDSLIPDLEPESARSACSDFIDHLRRTPLLDIQEEYTRTFDLNPSTSLNLSHHKWGDDRERSSALAALSRLYRAAGFELSTGELPDYLPLILEFVAVSPGGAAGVIQDDYREEVEGLAKRLHEGGSGYARLLHVAAELFSGAPPEKGRAFGVNRVT